MRRTHPDDPRFAQGIDDLEELEEEELDRIKAGYEKIAGQARCELKR